jgi:hypothetical protein
VAVNFLPCYYIGVALLLVPETPGLGLWITKEDCDHLQEILHELLSILASLSDRLPKVKLRRDIAPPAQAYPTNHKASSAARLLQWCADLVFPNAN